MSRFDQIRSDQVTSRSCQDRTGQVGIKFRLVRSGQSDRIRKVRSYQVMSIEDQNRLANVG